MVWQIKNPRFRVLETDDGEWYWQLENNGKAVAESVVLFTRASAQDCLSWLRSDAATIPIVQEPRGNRERK